MTEAEKQIEPIREEIDALDDTTICNLAKRFACVRKIGKIKREHNLSVYDSKRETEQFARYKALAELHGIQAEEVCALFRWIVYFSKLAQKGTSLAGLRQRKFFSHR